MAESEDLREFIREITLRHERIWREMKAEWHGVREESRAVMAELVDTRDERQAHTRALWALVDKLENGGAAA